MSKNQRINQVEPLVTKKDARAVYDYLTSGGWVTEHNVTREFEKQVKNYVGRKYAVAVPNGTIAIYLALISAGIKKGDRVAVVSGNRLEYPEIVAGLSKAGLIAVLVNPRSVAREVEFFLNHSGCTGLVIENS